MKFSVYLNIPYSCQNESEYSIERQIKFPDKTQVISLHKTIQILFITKEALGDFKKIKEICKPWNYVRVMITYGHIKYKIYRYLRKNYIEANIIDMQNYRFSNDFRGMYEIDICIPTVLPPNILIPSGISKSFLGELTKKNILPVHPFQYLGPDLIYGEYRKRGILEIHYELNEKIVLKYSRLESNESIKGKEIYKFSDIQTAGKKIIEIIGEMGYV